MGPRGVFTEEMGKWIQSPERHETEEPDANAYSEAKDLIFLSHQALHPVRQETSGTALVSPE